MKKVRPPVTVVHCLAQDGQCDWRYDEHDQDWQCMHCGIWEKTAERVPVPIVSTRRCDNRDK